MSNMVLTYAFAKTTYGGSGMFLCNIRTDSFFLSGSGSDVGATAEAFPPDHVHHDLGYVVLVAAVLMPKPQG